MGTNDAKLITIGELKGKIDGGGPFKLVDVLPGEYFEKEHIPGAISIPYEEIEKKAPGTLGKGETIVVYCASYECPASTEVAKKLMGMGYTNVFDYKGGVKEWKEAGYPVHTGKVPVTST
jgi:rhodanese-related sulfurtransferase